MQTTPARTEVEPELRFTFTRAHIDGVLFDLDGVITRTSSVHAQAWKIMFDRFLDEWTKRTGQQQRAFDAVADYARHVDGLPRHEGVARFLASRGIALPQGEAGDPPEAQTIHGLGNRKNRLLLDLIRHQGVEIYPSTVALIRDLRRHGYRIAVVSSSANCHEILASAKLLALFDARVDGIDLAQGRLRGKPAPDTFLEAARRLHVSPSRAVVIEDAVAGVEAGRAGGFQAVIGVNRLDQAEALARAGATVVVPDLSFVAVAHGDVFDPTGDPLWLMIDDEFTATREHEFESLFAVSNGYLGSRGSIPLCIPSSDASILIAGVYDVIPPSALPELVVVPGWTLLAQSIAGEWLAAGSLTIDEHSRILDMRQGCFRRLFRFSDRAGRATVVRFLRIASLADRHVLLQSALCTPENYAGPLAIRSGFLQASTAAGATLSSVGTSRTTAAGPVQLLEGQTRTGIRIALAVAARITAETPGTRTPEIRRTTGKMDDLMEFDVEAGKTYRLEWLGVCHTSRDVPQPADAAVAHLERLLQEGVQPALHRHIDAWITRWDSADIAIGGDQDAQRAIRFAGYHLISAANPEDERVSIGAKALTGSSYKGHVFWDTEIFLLPFYTLTDPSSARALLMYRFHTLPAARDKAQRLGYRGALYAWESADTGEEVTPPYAITPVGGVVPVLTGVQAHHISADVAYAVWQYWQATGDDGFLCDAGGEILMETARFWASRGKIEADGRYHIREVIGPDEYHLAVDDNAYTNWMARWNLECAAAAAQLLRQRFPEQWQRLVRCLQLDENEPAEWQAFAAVMYTGADAASGLIEQFEGYHRLTEIDPTQYAPRSLPIDVILGRERTQAGKIIKQADVVMLLHLQWARISAAMREANFRYYEPRTEHGSSLSPAIHALIAARLGDLDMALRYFRQAREIDLANNMGNAAGGVHIASLGGMWQAIVFGFAGLRLNEDGLGFLPHCPPGWHSIRFVLQWRGQKLQVYIESSLLEIDIVDGTVVPVSVDDAPAVRVEAGYSTRWELAEGRWKETAHANG